MLKTTYMTRTTISVAKLVMKVVKFYNDVKYKNNFDYFVRDIRKEFPSELTYKLTVGKEPFIHKTIVDNDISETYAVIKIGDCYIEYSYQKLNWGEQLQDAFDDMKRNFLGELITLTKKSHSRNSPSVYLKTINGEEKTDVN
jgi:hypothetical protein